MVLEVEDELLPLMEEEKANEVLRELQEEMMVHHPCRRHAKHTKQTLCGFPIILMILSMVMWSMDSFGTWLKEMGFCFVDYYRRLSEWVPELPRPRKPPDPVEKKKLLILGLIAVTIKEMIMPFIRLKSQPSTTLLKTHRGGDGMLMTASLTDSTKEEVRDTPGELSTMIDQGPSKPWILDTVRSLLASGDRSDFIPGTFEDFETPYKMTGIAGTLEAHQKGRCKFDVVNDRGSITVLEGSAVYVPTLPCRLFCPQSFFDEYDKGHKGTFRLGGQQKSRKNKAERWRHHYSSL